MGRPVAPKVGELLTPDREDGNGDRNETSGVVDTGLKDSISIRLAKSVDGPDTLRLR